MKINKVLIIRFSSFGDIVQTSPIVEQIKKVNPKAQVDWITRSEFSQLVSLNQEVTKVWAFDRKLGLWGLVKFCLELRKENYDHVYDAHSNLRSRVIRIFLCSRIFSRPNWVTRSKDRWKRILLFNFRINKFPWPFQGIKSFFAPLDKWGISYRDDGKMVDWNFPSTEIQKIEAMNLPADAVILVPSAAWTMKRWPLDHWKELIRLMPKQKFIVLGGKEDTFCEELREVASERVFNLAGKLSLIGSCALVGRSKIVISADTGLLHVADVLGIQALSLMGPTAFGFTTGKHIKTLEVDLPCRPCTKDGRGKCSQDIYQKCLVQITPEWVARETLVHFAE